MIPNVIFFLLGSWLLFSCNNKQDSVTSVVEVDHLKEVADKLKVIDSEVQVTGEDIIKMFPKAKFERWVIAFAISGIEFDIWRIDSKYSLVLFPENEVSGSPWDKRPVGVILDADPLLKDMQEFAPELPSKEDLEYFGLTSRMSSVGLDGESVYAGFVLIGKGKEFFEDLEKRCIYRSTNDPIH